LREFGIPAVAVPENIRIEGVTGLPASIAVPPITYPRNFENTNSYRLGAEVELLVGWRAVPRGCRR